jgi:hypothetical protein
MTHVVVDCCTDTSQMSGRERLDNRLENELMIRKIDARVINEHLKSSQMNLFMIWPFVA